MNNIQKIIKEMEDDLSMARAEKSVVNDRTGYVSGFLSGEIKAIEKYIPMLTLLLTAETQTTVKKPDA